MIKRIFLNHYFIAIAVFITLTVSVASIYMRGVHNYLTHQHK